MSARLAIIGFGEVGQILAADLAREGAGDIIVHDRLFADPESVPSRAARAAPIRMAGNIAGACADRDLVISAVTAGQALAGARAAAPYLDGAFLLDLNSVAPQTRIASQQAVQAAVAGFYVEGAIMAPIAPKRLKTPILLGGPHAASLAPGLTVLGFEVQVFSDQTGRASAVKLSRSIFVKGLEAIVAESLACARLHGVEADVLATLGNTIPHPDWPALAHYLVTRPLVHGQRRSEEMAEAATMLDAAGLDSSMARATVETQARLGALGLGDPTDQAVDLGQLLDTIIERSARQARPKGPDSGSAPAFTDLSVPDQTPTVRNFVP